MIDTELLFALAKVEKLKEYNLWWQIVATLYQQSGKEALKYVKAFRRELRAKMMSSVPGKRPFAQANDYMRRTYIMTGKDYLEDFMIAMEYDRAKSARFWLPRRRVLEGNLHIVSSLQRFMDDEHSRFLGLMLPPGTGKTTLIKFLNAFIAGKYPDSCNMYISYGKGMVDVMYSSVLSMMTDSEYNFNEIFPVLPTLDTSAEYKTLSYRPEGTPPTLGLVALGGSVTGRTRANKFFITDDLVKNAELARSPERLITLYQDYTATLSTRKIGDEVKEIMLGTPWSLHDPLMTNKEKHEGKPGYYFIAFPVCDENGHSIFNYDHPDRYTDETVKNLKKDLDEYTFSSLYLMQPLEKAGAEFAPDKLKYYNGILPDGEPDNILFAADVAFGGGDYFSMPIAYQYGETLYISDVIYDKGDAKKTKPRVVEKIVRHKILMGQFEANNGGNEYCEAITQMLKTKGIRCSLSAKRAPNTQKKIAKIEQYMPEIKEMYFLSPEAREGNPDYVDFMRDLNTFSFVGKNLHDDAADSLAQLADFAYNRHGKAIGRTVSRGAYGF